MTQVINNTEKIFDVSAYKKDFPIFTKKIYGKPLVYLDNAATTHKPKAVMDKIIHFYTYNNSNIHRGVYKLCQMATDEFEDARKTVHNFINSTSTDEIIFTSGATDAINLVAHSYGKEFISEGDEIIISEMEHHANIVPWQMLCEEKGCKLRVIPINDDTDLDYIAFLDLLSNKTKFLALTHVSNSLGTVNNIKKFIDKAHEFGIHVLIDASQSIQHMQVDVQQLDVDFLVFSGHKLYAPTGIGVLYGKKQLLEQMPPYRTGGDMIDSVTFEKTTFAGLPNRFEAGTPNIAGAIGLAAAIKYISRIGMEYINSYETGLLNYALDKLSMLDEVTVYGSPKERTSVILFNVKGVHSHDLSTMLDLKGVAIRSGQHCTEPLMERLGVKTTARASISFYNTKEDINIFVESLRKVVKLIKKL
jgi:cysteine desulfurase/selenocysteine lyase